MINHTEKLVFDIREYIHLFITQYTMAVTKKEVHTLEISPEVFHNFQQLKNRIISMTGKEDLSDDELLDSFVSSFTHSYNQAQWSCGGWWCGNHTEQKKEKGECCGSC